MNPNELESLQWIQFALEDLKSAKLILDSSNDWVVPRNVCYLSQQSVEKFLKAIYIFENQRFHKVHDLDSLEIILLIVNEFQNRGLTLNSSILEIL